MQQLYKGFTLIELSIVVAIIGTLAAIAVPNFQNARVRAQVAGVQGNLRTLRAACNAYQLDWNRPPLDTDTEFVGGGAYVSLTTPVGYLTSQSTGLDVFQPAESERVYFGYTTRDHHIEGNTPDRLSAWDTSRLDYLFFSVAPDGDLDFGWTQMLVPLARFEISARDAVYDTSNGIRSSGDIMSSGARVY